MRKYLYACLGLCSLAGLVVSGFLANLNKSEWASWVQAVGSILAIAGAVWLTERQLLAARKLEADKRHLDDLLKTEIVYTLFGEANFLAEVVSELGISRTERSAVARYLDRMKEIEDAFRGLPRFELPGRGIAFGVLEAPKALGDLRVAAEGCVSAWSKSAQSASIPTPIAAEFRRAQVHAVGICKAGVRTCEDQILNIRTLMPVAD